MDIETRIREFIITELRWNGAPEHLTDDHPLIESGVIDSLGVLEIAGFLTQTYRIEVPEQDLVFDNFRSLEALVSCA